MPLQFFLLLFHVFVLLHFPSLLSLSSITLSSSTSSGLSAHNAWLVAKPALSREPEFCDQLPFPVLCYVQEYSSYRDVSWFTDMHEIDLVLISRGCHSVQLDNAVGGGSTELALWWKWHICVVLSWFQS